MKQIAKHITVIHSTELLKDYLSRLCITPGINRIGSGAFSMVFTQKDQKDTVVKVFSAIDEGYLAFINFCLKNQGNQWLPKILSLHRVQVKKKKSDRDYFIIFIKKYKLAKSKILSKRLRETLDVAFTSVSDKSDSSEYAHAREYINEVAGGDDDAIFLALRLMAPRDDALLKVINFITKKTESEFTNDLHDLNIMVDQRQLVITDPLCRVGSLSKIYNVHGARIDFLSI